MSISSHRKVAKGNQILTVAWTESSGTYSANGISAKAELKGDYYVLSGTKLFVPYANVADTILCAVRTEASQKNSEHGISLFIVPRHSEGLSVGVLSTIAGDKHCEVILDHVRVPRGNILGEPNHVANSRPLCSRRRPARGTGGPS